MTPAATIVGIGQTDFSKDSGRTPTHLAAEAAQAALADAGLLPGDVDGMVTYSIDPVEEVDLMRTLGLGDVTWSSRTPYAGGGSIGALVHAAAAVRGGYADVVLVWRALNSRSGSRFGGPKTAAPASSGHSGTASMTLATAVGLLTPASWLSVNARRYMHRFGVTNADFGRAVVSMRAYAATNPAAWYFERPLTLDEHQAERWVVEPVLRRPDCCQETDGAVALVVARADRGADPPQTGVRIAHATMQNVAGSEIATDHYLPDLSVLEVTKVLADRTYALSGLSPGDVDAAMIYDAFSPILLMQLEAWGFCPEGQAKDFIAAGNIDPGGSLPCNTHGGLIGEAYIHGLNLVTEAVRQVRGTAANQLARAEQVLVTSGRCAAILTS